jgi:hypothetical protein
MRLGIFFVLLGLVSMCAAEERPNLRKRTTDPQHRQACQRNLTRIFDALGQYEERYAKLPNWLSDLYPEFLSDRDVFVCPYVAKTGDLSQWRKGLSAGPGKSEKGPPTYYHYEFCLEPAVHVSPEDSDKTCRDYKNAQRVLLGDAVPIVRCLAHEPVLNLAVNGLIFESIDPVYWEENFAHIYPHLALAPRDIFPAVRQIGASQPHLAHSISSASPVILDICNYFNILLHDLPRSSDTNNLASLPKGVQKFGGIEFSIAGALHLTRGSRNLPFPRELHDIAVNQRCSQIHVLHGFVTSESPVENVAQLAVHYGDPHDVPSGTVPLPCEGSPVAWQTTVRVKGLKDRSLVVYRSTWDNPQPAKTVATLSFVSAMTEAAPFLLAITLE